MLATGIRRRARGPAPRTKTVFRGHRCVVRGIGSHGETAQTPQRVLQIQLDPRRERDVRGGRQAVLVRGPAKHQSVHMERTTEEAGEHQDGPGLRDRRQAEDAAAAGRCRAGARGCPRAAAAGEAHGDVRRARVPRTDRQVGRAEKTVRRTAAPDGRPRAGPVRGD